jgi:hypothetical protein
MSFNVVVSDNVSHQYSEPIIEGSFDVGESRNVFSSTFVLD